MKSRAIVLAFLAVIICLAGYNNGLATEEKATGVLRIGVVSVEQVFKNSRRSAAFREEAADELDRLEAELDKLGKEIEAEKAGLRTLKPGSSEHLGLMEGILTKSASYQAKQKFYEQQMMVKEQRMIEGLYKSILEQTAKVAEAKGLDLVFERSEPKLPASSGNELTVAISTHKVLYSKGAVDITEDVLAGVDSDK